jgi:arginine/lysine/ornithine decarboxylase
MLVPSEDFIPRHQATPLLDTLKFLVSQQDAPFYAPGHKRGRGIPQKLADLYGNSVFSTDLPELPELDNLFAPTGVIAASQVLAAEVFGAEKTWFLINGSSCGIVAAILATCAEDQKIIVPRNIHKSLITGLILSGAQPIFITPEYNQAADLIYSVTPAALEATLQAHPDARAVFLLYPTYQGIGGDLETLAAITHQYNLPLLVDEAHGGHFAFHPDLPPSALSLGADLTVQSTHKVLGAMTQASLLHIQGDRLDPAKITEALQLVQTTSPSYLLLASLDAARQQMALEGFSLMAKTLALAQLARAELARLPHLRVLSLEQPTAAFRWLDSTRLTVDVSGLGLTGYQVDEILRSQFQVTAELPLLRHLTFIISLGNNQEDIEQLIRAFRQLEPVAPTLDVSSFAPSLPIQVLSPREAWLSPSHFVPRDAALGKVSAELICPYPPGIPVLLPGELINAEALDYLQTLLRQGAVITGCSDPSLETVKICKDCLE